MLSFGERERYGRHLILPEVGEEGQLRLMDSRVLIVGAGGLGSPAALYLAAAGVGTIGLADGDHVELSNLQRQIIHDSHGLGELKTASATKRLQAINPGCRVIEVPQMLDADSLSEIVREYDFVLDATDSLTAKFMINDVCVARGVPFSHGGILRFEGQTMTIVPGVSACYRCLFGEPPPVEDQKACEQAGVFGVLPGVIGTIQAAEALKSLLGIGSLLTDRILTFDLLAMRFREVRVQRDGSCKTCGHV